MEAMETKRINRQKNQENQEKIKIQRKLYKQSMEQFQKIRSDYSLVSEGMDIKDEKFFQEDQYKSFLNKLEKKKELLYGVIHQKENLSNMISKINAN